MMTAVLKHRHTSRASASDKIIGKDPCDRDSIINQEMRQSLLKTEPQPIKK